MFTRHHCWRSRRRRGQGPNARWPGPCQRAPPRSDGSSACGGGGGGSAPYGQMRNLDPQDTPAPPPPPRAPLRGRARAPPLLLPRAAPPPAAAGAPLTHIDAVQPQQRIDRPAASRRTIAPAGAGGARGLNASLRLLAATAQARGRRCGSATLGAGEQRVALVAAGRLEHPAPPKAAAACHAAAAVERYRRGALLDALPAALGLAVA